MPTKIQQIAVMLDGLDKYELECVKSLTNQAIRKRPPTGCKFLDLPRELRDHIYSFVAMWYLEWFGCYRLGSDGVICPLFVANKQIRVEFMDLCYSKQMVKKIEVFSEVEPKSGQLASKENSWDAVENARLTKLVMNNGQLGVHFFPGMSKALAQRSLERAMDIEDLRSRQTKNSADESSIFGVFELALDREYRFSAFRVKRMDIERLGLEDELPNMGKKQTSDVSSG